MTILSSVSKLVFSLPRETKWALAVCCDVVLFSVSTWFAFWIRLDGFVSLNEAVWTSAWIASMLGVTIFSTFGLYRAIFRWPGSAAIFIIFKASAIYGVAFFSLIVFLRIEGVPRTIGIIQPLLMVFFVTGSRLAVGLIFGQLFLFKGRKKTNSRAMIYGAGYAGIQLAKVIRNNQKIDVFGFIDDNPEIQGRSVAGLTVFPRTVISSLIEANKISHVLVAMPSIARHQRDHIVAFVSSFNVAVRVMPSLDSIANGEVRFKDFDDLNVDHLLGRVRVEPSYDLMASRIAGRSVLVSGAGGSIGSEICRQLLRLKPTSLILYEISEYALYSLVSELESLQNQDSRYSNVCVIPVLGSVQDAVRVKQTFENWNPNIIYHAAAYKHVPLVEANLIEGFKNNVFGTWIMAIEAINNGVSDFVLVSTDKAVRPTNAMGATKRLAEMILQCMQKRSCSKTRFSMVRFGNVLASSGSVIPKFIQQLREGGPITVTDPNVTRYFMAIPEAAQLVIQASGLAEGGDVFVLDMGRPVKIIDLARKLIRLSGFTERNDKNPYGDIEIEITGLRAGEKLYEELLIGGTPLKTVHPKILKATETHLPWPVLEPTLQAAKVGICENDERAVVSLLQELISEYHPSAELMESSSNP